MVYLNFIGFGYNVKCVVKTLGGWLVLGFRFYILKLKSYFN